MSGQTINHTERISCPQCGEIQDANVYAGGGMVWPIYVRDCNACGHTITESEWNIVECVYIGGVCNSSRCPAHKTL